MIDIDEVERQAKSAVGDESIRIHRDELLFLINRYREFPDLTPEEKAEAAYIPGIGPNPDLTEPARQVRKCQAELKEAKRRLEQSRGNFSLFAECPDCHARIGRYCNASGHEARFAAAFDELRRIGGSTYGETV